MLHLPEHIHRFGPAALFATEGFESFNAVIRAKSIHSNRQSPSHDIARAFAHGNRIRHILSGAHIRINSTHSNIGNQIKKLIERPHPNALDAGEAGVWWPAGTAPMTLVSKPNIVTDYLGMDSSSISKKGVLMISIYVLCYLTSQCLQDLAYRTTFPCVHIMQPKLVKNSPQLSHHFLRKYWMIIVFAHAGL